MDFDYEKLNSLNWKFKSIYDITQAKAEYENVELLITLSNSQCILHLNGVTVYNIPSENFNSKCNEIQSFLSFVSNLEDNCKKRYSSLITVTNNEIG